MDNSFDIHLILNKLGERRNRFIDEKDLQLELVNIIEEVYPNVKQRMEYQTSFNRNKTDILVILDNRYYPIEVKYPRKNKNVATNTECYDYLNDIRRIEEFRDKEPLFEKGYTILLTNDEFYSKPPTSEDVDYVEFSIHEGAIKNGSMNWKSGSSKLNDKKYKDPIILKGTYTMNWKVTKKINDENTGTYMYLVNEIDK